MHTYNDIINQAIFAKAINVEVMMTMTKNTMEGEGKRNRVDEN